MGSLSWLASGTLSGAIAVVLIGLLTKMGLTWFRKELDLRFKTAYAEFAQGMETEIRVRAEAEKVAEFLLEWNKTDMHDYSKLNRLALEMSLWLSSDVLRKLGSLIRNEPEANADEVILLVRRVLRGSSDDLQAKEILRIQTG